MKTILFSGTAIGVLAFYGFALSTPIVIDGDTIRYHGQNIRLTDFDAPELFSPRCNDEFRLALATKRRLKSLIENNPWRLESISCGTHNYGRPCARLTIRGLNVAETMIAEGLAVEYICVPNGGGCPPKVDWCAKKRKT